VTAPVRVLSLLPSATEIVAVLGAAGQLVGITHECDFPAAVRSCERVTECAIDSLAAPAVIDAQVREITGQGLPLYTLRDAVIAALRPDLILTQALCEVCAVMETDVRALAARLTPEPRVISLSATSLDSVFGDIALVGAALQLGSAAEELISGFRGRLRTVHDTLKEARAPRPRVAFIEWNDPIFAGGHWVPEMVHRAGGIDVLAKAGEHSHAVTLDSVIAADPDVVIIAPCGYGLDRAAAEAQQLFALPEWSFLRTRHVWALDANALTSRPGPRLIDGVEVMARIFNPSLFTPINSTMARAVPCPPSAP
jgi:iron complex transport system substrate-binding protein